MTPIVKRPSFLLKFAAVLVAACLSSGCILDDIDAAIEQLRAANLTLEQVAGVLKNLEAKLNQGVYRDQVTQIAERVGQVAQITAEASVDFVRSRVLTDLLNLKHQIKHEPLEPRDPVLSSAVPPAVDLTSESRRTVTVVGWNLDVAQANPTKYFVSVVKDDGTSRAVEVGKVTYQGQYQVSVDVSPNGVAFGPADRKLVFNGFVPLFEVPIVNNTPPVPVVALQLHSNQDRDNKDKDIAVHILLTIDHVPYVDVVTGRGATWDDNTDAPVDILQSVAGMKVCIGDAFGRWGPLELPNHVNEMDGTCLHRVADSRVSSLPPLTGRRSAEMTIETLNDTSGWGTSFRLLALTGLPSPRNQITLISTESHMFNRNGNGGRSSWTFSW